MTARVGHSLVVFASLGSPVGLLGQQPEHQWLVGFSIGQTMSAVTTVPAFQDYVRLCGAASSSGRGVAVTGDVTRQHHIVDTRFELAFHAVPSAGQTCPGDLSALDPPPPRPPRAL